MSNQDTRAEHDHAPPAPAEDPLKKSNSYLDDAGGAAPKKRKLAPILDHVKAKDLKELFKCSMAVWIVTIFIVIDPVLRAEGQAMFFGCILLFIAPPSGIVFIQLLVGITILLGMGLAWAWGVLTMKAALAARPQAETNARLAQLQQASTQNATNIGQLSGQTTYTQVLIFEGFMLDARVTAVYYCMICAFIYALARYRVSNPKFVAVQIFGTIISDVFLTTGPLLPTFKGTIPITLIKPAATAVGVGIFCNLFLFPESTSHIVLSNIKQILSPMPEFVDACRMSLDQSARPMSLQGLRKAKAEGVASFKALEGRLNFLPFDVSVCRWNVQDIGLLKKPLQYVFLTWVGLLEAQISRTESKARMAQLIKQSDARIQGKLLEDEPKFGRHHIAQELEFAELFRNAESEDLIKKSVAALQRSADPLFRTCTEALEALIETLNVVNENKWYGRPTRDTLDGMHHRHKDILNKLHTECQTFTAITTPRILDPHAHLFDEHGDLRPPASIGAVPLRGVVLGLIFEERIVSFAQSLEKLLDQVVVLEGERHRQRLWLPAGLRAFGSWVSGREPTPQVTPTMPELGLEQEKSRSRQRHHHRKRHSLGSADGEELPAPKISEQLASLHLHRGKTRNPFGRFVLTIARWVTSTAGMFGLRIVISTIAISIPAAIPSSAGFYYREKGLWALIMTQLSISTYAADFTYGLLLRIAGTVIGGLLGMLAWYMGSGGGPGNSYGFAAAMVPFIVILMWLRLFGPPPFLQAFIIAAATLYLTAGYSWVDTHIPSYGNPGVGYSVFWRRVVLVLVGFTASAVVTYFPRPPSASRHYRHVLSQTLSTFQDRYALLITKITLMEHNKSVSDTSGTRPIARSDLLTTVQKDTIETAEILSSIIGPINLLKFEFSSTDFTATGLGKIASLATNVNFNLFQLFYYISLLPIEFKRRFLLLSGVLEENFVGDFMSVLSLLSHSLETGNALPHVLSAPLTVRAFRERLINRGRDTTEGDSHEDVGEDEADASHMKGLLGPVTRKMLENDDEGFRKYCVVLSALVGLLNAIDEMVLVVKEELGEAHFVDIERWSEGTIGRATRQVEVDGAKARRKEEDSVIGEKP